MYSLYYVYVSKNRSLRCSNHFVGFLNLAMHSKGIWLFSVILVECSNHSIALSILIIIIWEILISSICGCSKTITYIGILKSMDKLIITICLHQFVFTTTVYYYYSSSYHQGYSLCCMFEGNQIQNSRTLQQEIQLPELLIQM